MEKKQEKKAGQGREFSEMTKKQRGKFLSNDFIERMIRVEQRVSASFGHPIPYNETEHYKSLSEEEKKEFEKYLEKSKRKKFLLSFLVLLPLFLAILLKTEFTGRVIQENFNASPSFLSIVFILLFVLVAILALISSVSRKLKESRLNKHFNVLEHILKRRLFTENEKAF